MAKVKFKGAAYVRELGNAFRHGFVMDIEDESLVKTLIDTDTVEVIEESSKPKRSKAKSTEKGE